MSRNVLDAANTISFNLDELLDEAEATAIKEELDELLEKLRSGENMKSQLREVLKRNDKVRQWTHEFLNPSDTSRLGYESYQELPGESQPIGGMKKYICPEGGFYCSYWFPHKAGQKIPKCCKHGITLVPEQQEEEMQS